MPNHEKAVVEAAHKFADALEAAQAEGYRVNVAINPADLRNIAVSETARVAPQPIGPKPATLANPKPEGGGKADTGSKPAKS